DHEIPGEGRRVRGTRRRGRDVHAEVAETSGAVDAVGRCHLYVDAQLGDGMALAVVGRRVDVEAIGPADAEAEAEVPAQFHAYRSTVHPQLQRRQAGVVV